MKKLVILLSAIVLMTSACSQFMNKGGKEAPATAPEKSIKVGDVVVGAWMKTSYYEGKVLSIQGSKAKIEWLDMSSPSDVDMTEVYMIPKAGTTPGAKVGDIVLAKPSTGTKWPGAEVTSIGSGVIGVKYISDGRTDNVSTERIIVITPALAANFKDEASKSDFLTKAKTFKPLAPAGYKYNSGEKVVAEWTSGSWYTGKVRSASSDKVTVAWDDGSKPSELVFEKVVPYPTADNTQTPAINGYVLIKPASGSRWDYGQVVSLAAGTAQVKTSTGETKTLRPGELIVLQ